MNPKYDVYQKSDMSILHPEKFPNEYWRIGHCLSIDAARKMKVDILASQPNREPRIFPMQAWTKNIITYIPKKEDAK